MLPNSKTDTVDAASGVPQTLATDGVGASGGLPNLTAALAALNRSSPASPGRDVEGRGDDTEAEEDDDEHQSQIPGEQLQQPQDNGRVNSGASAQPTQRVKKAPAKARSTVLATPTLPGGFATLPEPHPNTGGPLKQAIDIINRNAHAGGHLAGKFDAGTVGPQDSRCVERLHSAHAAVQNLTAQLRDIARNGPGVDDCDLASVKGTVDELVKSGASLQTYVADVAHVAVGAADALQALTQEGEARRREIADCKRDIAELKGAMRVRSVTNDQLPALPIPSPTTPARRPPSPIELISPAAKRFHADAHVGGVEAGRSSSPGLYVGPYVHFSGKSAAARLSEVCAMLNQLDGARTRAPPYAATANENDSFATVYFHTLADRDSVFTAWPPKDRKYGSVTVEKVDNLPPPEQEPVRNQRNFARNRVFGTR